MKRLNALTLLKSVDSAKPFTFNIYHSTCKEIAHM